MANAISSAGMLVKYKVEASVGSTTPPASGFTTISGVKAIPAFGDEVNTIQTTPLSATKNHTYIEGLADSGGAIALTVNDYSTFRTAWASVLSAHSTAAAANKELWFEFAYPTGSNMDSFYFKGTPIAMGFGGAEVDSVLENNANIIPTSDYLFTTAST